MLSLLYRSGIPKLVFLAGIGRRLHFPMPVKPNPDNELLDGHHGSMKSLAFIGYLSSGEMGDEGDFIARSFYHLLPRTPKCTKQRSW